MQRREWFQILGAGALSTAATAADIAKYKPRFFSAADYARLQDLCDEILPGAKQAGVAFYIDTVVHHGSTAQQYDWRSGMKEIQGKLLTDLVKHETAPRDLAERFFVTLKRSTIEAYYLSKDGRAALGYQGDKAIHRFDGCTHPEHQS
jgi:hypothetical protein